MLEVNICIVFLLFTRVDIEIREMVDGTNGFVRPKKILRNGRFCLECVAKANMSAVRSTHC